MSEGISEETLADTRYGIITDPVEILVDMASRGEIDPWNIDIVDVTDKFLKRLEELKQLELRISGRTLFYASILLRMKSEVLLEDEPNGHDAEYDYFNDPGFAILDPTFEYSGIAPVMRIEPRIRRKSKRPVILDELIEELGKAEVVGERRAVRKRERENIAPLDIDEILDIIHEEDITKKTVRIEELLADMFKTCERVFFDDMLVDRARKTVISTYIPLLFLANNGSINLEQEEIFGELYITRRGC